MAHFAKISEDNIVLSVLTFNDSDMTDENGNSSESIGQQYLQKHNNWPAHLWIQTSYNTYGGQHIKNGIPFRGNYAATGYIWDEENQIFWPKKPYASWVKHIPSASWKSPIGDAPSLTEEQTSQNRAFTHMWEYRWNEENQSWDLNNFKVS
jgi:hypothetical protein